MRIKNIYSSILIVWISFFGICYAFKIPVNNGRVTDQADIFSDTEEWQLETQLQALEEKHKAEIAILTVSNLAGNDITQAAYEVATAWGVWKEDADNGLLILIAPNERERRIEVGYGLEWDIPDILAYRLGRQDLVPAFVEEKYFQWVTTLVDHLSWAVAWTYQIQDITNEWTLFENFLTGMFMLLFIWFIVGLIVRSSIDASWKKISISRKKNIFQSASFLNMIPGFLIVWTWWLLYLIPLYFLRKWVITSDSIKTLWWNSGGWSSGGWYSWGSFWGWFSGFWWGSFGGGGSSGGW